MVADIHMGFSVPDRVNCALQLMKSFILLWTILLIFHFTGGSKKKTCLIDREFTVPRNC